MDIPKAKFGYLLYDDMVAKIQSGIFDSYDFIYTKDTHEGYVVTEDLKPVPLRSRVYSFNSVQEATDLLNKSSDTYNGQFVAILDGNVFKGYIVNTVNGKFIPTILSQAEEPIDYDTLGNKPVTNLVGTLDKPVMVCNLKNGIYNIKGQYRISALEMTTYLSASNVIFIVGKEQNNTKIKKISSDEIVDYVVSASAITKNSYSTEKYLAENHYATTDYVDKKAMAMEVSLRNELQLYVKTIVNELFAVELDKRIDERISTNIQPITTEQINKLF